MQPKSDSVCVPHALCCNKILWSIRNHEYAKSYVGPLPREQLPQFILQLHTKQPVVHGAPTCCPRRVVAR